MASIKRTFSLCVVALAFGALLSGGEAEAAMPWWHVNTVSASATAPDGESTLLLEVSDLGDAAVDGSASPVTIVDHLPPGVNAKHVFGEGGGSFPIGINGAKEFMHCTLPSQSTVNCTYDGPLLAYERLIAVIEVEVEPGAGASVSEVEVSGGGAATVVSKHALALANPVPGFGMENYEVAPEEEGGGQDTQAGSHPFQLTSTLTFNTKAVPVFSSELKKR